MKLSLFILLLSVFSYAQVKKYDGEKYLEFTLKYATDTTTVDGIDWKRENLISEFTLKGKFPLKYSVTLLNDSEALLSQYKNSKWVLQDTIEISGWTSSYIEGNTIISKFKITDFDKDGNEDLTCWIFTNMHNDISTTIFLNNPKQQKLIKLYDFAEDTDVWMDPKYNSKSKKMYCIDYTGLYGLQSENTYKLISQVATPINKTTINTSDPALVIKQKYIGKHNKWQLISEYKVMNPQTDD